MFVLSSIQPDAARRKKGRSKPDRVLRQAPRTTPEPARPRAPIPRMTPPMIKRAIPPKARVASDLARDSKFEKSPKLAIKVTTKASEPRLCRKTPSSARERAIFSPGKDGEAGDVCFIVDTAGCSQVGKGPLEARSGFPTEPNTTNGWNAVSHICFDCSGD